MPSHAHKKHHDNHKPKKPVTPTPAPVDDRKPPIKPKPVTPQQPKPVGEPGVAKPAPVAPAGPTKPVDLADPKVVIDEDTKAADPYDYRKNDRGASLYGPNGVQALDVRQGAIGDCYFAAAVAAVASSRPDAIKNALKDNKDGTYTVRFFEVGWDGSKTSHLETVDADLPHRADAPAYLRSTEVVDGKQSMELWPALLEKAYASWKGSYDAIGHGGVSGDVMTALTGERSRQSSTKDYGAPAGQNDPLWTKMKAASDQKKAMTAGTGGHDDPRYKDPEAGVYGWHAYTVMGVEEVKNGDKQDRFVILRNPWSKRRRDSDAAAVGDTVANQNAGGVFKLSWAEFRRLYDDVSING